jgi:hypothetical protein
MRLIRKTFLNLGLSLFICINSFASGGSAVRETIWLDTGRDIFLCGEEIIVSVGIMEVDTYSPSLLSKIVNLELLNDKGMRILGLKLELTDGKALASIPVSSKLSSGWYYIRAYTRWMQNFSNSDYSIYPVKIVNPSELSKVPVLEGKKADRIEVMPEWGRLVANRTNRCAFFMADNVGDGIASTCYLVNSSLDTISSLVSDETGWGKFDWIPVKDENYNIITDSGESVYVRSVIPDIIDNSALFEITEDKNGLIVSYTGIERVANVKLIVHGLYTKYWSGPISMAGSKAVFKVPFSELPDGIVQLSFISGENEFVGGRLYSKGSGTAIIEPEINLSNNNPGMHDKIDVEFNIPGIRDKKNMNFVNFIVGLSEPGDESAGFIPGMRGWPASAKIPVKKEAFESWLIGNLYNNSVIADIRNSQIDFVPETRGVSISGKVIDDKTGEGVEKIGVSLSFTNSTEFYSTKTFSNGRFHFTFPDCGRSDAVTVSFSYDVPSTYSIQIVPEFDERVCIVPEKEFVLSVDEINFVRRTNAINQLEEIYNTAIDTIINEDYTTSRDTIPFFGTANITVSVDKYIRLLNIREIVYEVVPHVFARKEGKSYKIVVIGEYSHPFGFNTLILLDGIPYTDHNKILDLPPRMISYIDVIHSFYIHGNTGFAGIVNFRSKNGDMAGLKMPKGSYIFSFNKPEPNYYFRSNESGDKTISLRNTLEFKLSDSPGKNVFPILTNDVFGKYTCTVSGFDNKGNWIHSKKYFTIFQ